MQKYTIPVAATTAWSPLNNRRSHWVIGSPTHLQARQPSRTRASLGTWNHDAVAMIAPARVMKLRLERISQVEIELVASATCTIADPLIVGLHDDVGDWLELDP